MSLKASEKIMYDVLHVTKIDANSNPIGTATGFVFRFFEREEEPFLCLVTNRHVVKGCSNIQITFTREEKPGIPKTRSPIPVIVPSASAIFHPDEQIDLAILPLNDALDFLARTENKPFFTGFTVKNIPTENEWNNFSVIENVVMAGYPENFYDAINNQPIFRSGITATHPKLDFMGTKEFLVDMPCFFGCSGSPVFTCSEGMYTNKSPLGISVMAGDRIQLLGIQHAIHLSNSVGKLEIINSELSNGVLKPIVPLYLNLGFIIKSTELLVFENIIRTQNRSREFE